MPGGTIALPINFASTGGAQSTGLQWTFSFPSDITGVTVVAGTAATDAGKSISCSGNNCLIVGFNSNVIANGTVAVATFQIAANPSNNPIPIQLTGAIATTAGGTSIPATGNTGAISLPVSLPTLSSVSCTSSTINTPGSTSCTVSLTGAAAVGGFAVALSSNNANLSVPSIVTVAAGQTANSFTATGAQVSSNQSAIITASAGGVNKTQTLSLVSPAQLTSVACAPSTLGSSASSTCTVTLNKAATSVASVSLSSNNVLLTVPANVTASSGQSSVTFTATSGTVSSSQSAIVTASLNGQNQTATISLTAAAQLSSLNCSPATVNAPGSASCTATLTAAASSAVSVALQSNNANVTVPGSVNIGAGASSAAFTATVAAVVSDQTALLTGTLNAVSRTFTLTASAPPQLTSLACAPSTLGSSASSTCTLTLNKAATSAASVSLSSNNLLLTVPANVTVASGQSTATFTAASGTVSSSQNAIVTASLNGQSQQGTISLTAAIQLSGVSCSPAGVTGPGTSACTVTLTAAASSALSVALQSNNASVTVPGSVNIGAGASSATFTATATAVASNQTVLVTATLNGVSKAFTLTVTGNAPAQLTSVACAPSTLGSSASSTCTLTLDKAATSAATVSLTSNNGLLTVPANVTVASGQSGATFAAVSGTVSSSQSAIVTATLNAQSKTATISLVAAAQVSSVSCSPSSVTGPGTSACTVTLTAAASSAVSVTIQSNNASVTVPGSLNIGAGANSAAFAATVAAVVSDQTVMVTATLNGVSKTFTLTAKAPKGRPKSLSCSPSAMTSHVSSKCTVSLDAAAPIDSVVSIASNTTLLSVPSTVTIPAGQSSAIFDAASGSVNGSQKATVTADLDGQSQNVTLTLGAPVDCQEFQTSPGGLCMIQDVFPWISFGGGWESRLSAGNLSNGTSGGTMQFSFTLLPATPATGGVQNHMPASFTDNKSGQMQLGDNATYALNAGESVAIDFLSPAGGCDIHGQNCGSSPDPNANVYGSVLVQYVADKPATLRGIAKAQLTLLANAANGTYGWQTTEREMPAANLWTAPVAVSANQSSDPQTNQQASAAFANPGPLAITVRGTLYDEAGHAVTFRDFQVPSLGAIALVFSQDPSQPFGGFGQAMFPLGKDFNGQVTFQVLSPSGGVVAATLLQYVGNAVSSVELNSQSLPASSASASRCAEFAAAPDGTCTVQYTLPWVVFGGGWESRLKASNSPSAPYGGVQVRFTLVPAISTANGLQNHLPAYFSDNQSGFLRVGESSTYTLNAGQSVDIHFLNPPAGCDSSGQNCANQPDLNALSFGSMLVQYSSTDPASLRGMARPQLAFLARPSGEAYSAQITERTAAAASRWTAPVVMSANQGAVPQTNQQASAAITNSGTTEVTVRGTLRDQSGNVVTYHDFVVPASGSIGVVFTWEPGQPFGGFGNAAFPQGQDFNGWVTFEVTSQGGGVSVLVLQYRGNTMSSVNVQSLP
ncbi:MAG: hypothetical protein ABI833_12495 [Acidobacteriota bacterium]